MRKSYFISYNHRDVAWAKWVAEILDATGETKTVFWARDRGEATNFWHWMIQNLNQTEATIFLLSENSLKSGFVGAEIDRALLKKDALSQMYSTRVGTDPAGAEGRIRVVCVDHCEVPSIFNTFDVLFLHELGFTEAARQKLLEYFRPTSPIIYHQPPPSRMMRVDEEFPDNSSESGLLKIITNLLDVYPYYNDTEQEDALYRFLKQYTKDLAVSHGVAPKLLAYLRKNPESASNVIAQILRPLCQILQDRDVNDADVEGLAETLESYRSRAEEEPRAQVATNEFLARVLTHILYHRPALLEQQAALQRLLRDVANRRDPWWDYFFAESQLRHLCHYIFLPLAVQALFSETSQRYRTGHSKTPLAKIWDWVLDPSAFVEQFNPGRKAMTKRWVLEQIRPVAARCTQATECRWCITALVRISALTTFTEEEPDYFNEVRELIKVFPAEVVRHSPALQFSKLFSLLREFNKTRKLDALKTFDKEFDVSALHPLQVPHLQIEYASALAVFAELRPDEAATLDVTNYFLPGHNPLQSKLFHSALVTPADENQLLNISQQFVAEPAAWGLQRWLSKYIEVMNRVHTRPVIKDNHLRAREYPCSLTRPEIRQNLRQQVTKSMQRFAQFDLSAHAAFAAHSASVFPLAGTRQDHELVWEYVKAALLQTDAATTFHVQRNAANIGKALYQRYYYGPPEDRPHVLELADSFAAQTKIGSELQPPRLHWAYYGALRAVPTSEEAEFLHVLYETIPCVRWWAGATAVPKSVDMGAFSDVVKDTVEFYSSKKRLLARALGEDLMSPETWNLFGTTVYDNSPERSINDLEIAAQYYSLASYFAKERVMFDQKYRFNFIRVWTELFEKRSERAYGHVFGMMLRYLREPRSRHFTYRVECTAKLWDILDRAWDNLPVPIRVELEGTLGKWWLEKDAEELPALQALRARFELPASRHKP